MTAKEIRIKGIVQGVGFRPFVFQLATELELRGYVVNTPDGVAVLIEGEKEAVASFVERVKKDAPPLSIITTLSERDVPHLGAKGFSIEKSRVSNFRNTLISPDVAVCKNCLAELFDPNDRRYRYPFINCTNCGPRYTIIEDIPYDRAKTSMKGFVMCEPCRREYEDPSNRRFHAQPNACFSCGPALVLHDRNREIINACDPVEAATELIRGGRIIAMKGLGGFHLVVDALNEEAVSLLRERKSREEKPFAVMCRDIEQAEEISVFKEDEKKILKSFQSPIVLVEKRRKTRLAPSVAPNNRYLGVMLPYTPLHHILMRSLDRPVVMTSGNLSEEPICIGNDEAFDRLDEIADYFLVHNRDIYLRSDDSVCCHTAGRIRLLRRSRGYVPVPVFLGKKIPSVLACGAELKNTVCLTKGDMAFLSQHIGDLKNEQTLDFFEMTISHMMRIIDVQPEIVACDLHPDYLSSSFAKSFKAAKDIIAVQHHHAHIASCMAENRLEGPVLGLSFDGTGLGTDGRIWGGEVMIADYYGFERVGHLAYVPMPGGEASIKKPYRMAIAHLYDAFGDEAENLDLFFLSQEEERDVETIFRMIKADVNSPLTSSLGRLFDSVSAICGIRKTVSFEGQAAMELEMAAGSISGVSAYDWKWEKEDGAYQIMTAPIIRGVFFDAEKGMPAGLISARFHATLIKLFVELCGEIRKSRSINRVVLSGGVFQNRILLEGIIRRLEKSGFIVYAHSLVPANDGGISLGQALVAAARVKNGGLF